MTYPPSFESSEPALSVELIDRYLAGLCTVAERELVQGALEGSPPLREALALLQTSPLPPGEYLDVEAAWREVEHLLNGAGAAASYASQQSTAQRGTEGRQRGWPMPPLRRMAWSGVLVWGLVVAAALLGSHTAVHTLTQQVAYARLTYTTANGERANITLPDGNTVALSVASRLDVPAGYSTGDHTVYLQGEALFTVTHHDRTPFTVVTSSATARVLGTSFVVRHYVTDSNTVLAVRDGRVAVRSTVLTTGRQGTFAKDGRVTLRAADSTQFSFATGVLTLDGVPLREAIAELDRWYDADVRLGDSTLSRRELIGDLPTGSIAALAQALEVTLHVRVQREGRVLTLFPR